MNENREAMYRSFQFDNSWWSYIYVYIFIHIICFLSCWNCSFYSGVWILKNVIKWPIYDGTHNIFLSLSHPPSPFLPSKLGVSIVILRIVSEVVLRYFLPRFQFNLLSSPRLLFNTFVWANCDLLFNPQLGFPKAGSRQGKEK